jgi:hypothetical protein
VGFGDAKNLSRPGREGFFVFGESLADRDAGRGGEEVRR